MIDVYRWDGSAVHKVAKQAEPPDDEGSWLWVDLVGEDPDTVRQIGRRFQIDDGLIEEAIQTSSLPLVEEHVDTVFVVLHGFTTGRGERLSTPEVDFFIGARYLISLRETEIETLTHLKQRLVHEQALPAATPAGLLGLLAGASGKRFTPLILELERQVDALEELAIRGDPQTIVEIHALRRDVIYLRRTLAPQFDVYEDLSESTHPLVDDIARRLFVKAANHHRRSLEALEAGRSLLSSVLETYRGAVADQTNEIMRVLTVFSAILLPLALIAGLWGMNFNRIPGATVAWGFWGLIGVMALLAGSVWVYFARRGFIGAPRIRDLPKAVGLGLFNIGTAPIRVVAEGIRQMGKSEDR